MIDHTWKTINLSLSNINSYLPHLKSKPLLGPFAEGVGYDTEEAGRDCISRSTACQEKTRKKDRAGKGL